MSEGTSFPSPIRLEPWPDGEARGRVSHDPFIRLVSDAHPLRAYLARLEVGGRVVVPRLSILMEPNEYPGSGVGGARALVGNRRSNGSGNWGSVELAV